MRNERNNREHCLLFLFLFFLLLSRGFELSQRRTFCELVTRYRNFLWIKNCNVENCFSYTFGSTQIFNSRFCVLRLFVSPAYFPIEHEITINDVIYAVYT